MERVRDVPEAGADDLGGGRPYSTKRRSGGRRAWLFDGSEGGICENDAADSVVHTDVQFTTACATYNISLYLLIVVGIFCSDFTEGNDKLKEVTDLDRAVRLRKLREKARKDGMLKKGDTRRARTGSERLQNRGNGGRQGEWSEGDPERVVERLEDGWRKLQSIARQLDYECRQ